MTVFQNVPLDIVGSSYESRSLSISAQTTKNLYPEITPTGKVVKALHTWFGISNWVSATGSPGRGTKIFNGKQYQVSGSALYEVDQNGVRINLGVITGSNPVVMVETDSALVITTGGTGYSYDGSTLQQIADPQFDNGNSCAYLNRQVIYDGNFGQFQVSLPGNPTSIDPLDIATAESAPDDTIRVFVKDQLLYIFGTASFEIWYNSGVGNPPFDRIQNGVRDIGLISPYAVADTTETIYFMGSDQRAYRMIGYKEQSITSAGIAHIFADFDMTNCTASHVEFDGNELIVFRFPAEGRTFGYSENADFWFELTTGSAENNYFISTFGDVYGNKYIEDARTGAIYIVNFNSYGNAGEEMIRERVSSPVSGDALNSPGQRLLMDRIRLVLEKGVGIPVGQGSDPQIAVSLSFDGGNSWTNEAFIDVERTGERMIPIDYYHSAEFYEMMIKIRMSDPVFLSLHNASIDIAATGGY